MDRNVLIERLRARRSELTEAGVRRLALFGPAARGELGLNSEVNLLVDLAPPLTFDRYLSVRDALAGLLGQNVELVMEDLRHPNIWPHIQDDVVEIW